MNGVTGLKSFQAGLPPWLVMNACVALVVAHGFVTAVGLRPSWQAMLYAHVALAAAIFAVIVVVGAILALLTILPGGSWVVRCRAWTRPPEPLESVASPEEGPGSTGWNGSLGQCG
jgi:hypothetical protein